MKLVIIAQEMPFPPMHGGTADIWRRLCALRTLGHEVFLVTWAYVDADRTIEPSHVQRLQTETSHVCVYPLPRTIVGFARRLPHLFRWPSHAAARILPRDIYAALREKVLLFNPDAVMVDGLLACPVAERLTIELEKPLLYRAHNREYAYLSGQRNRARTLRSRISLRAATLHLQSLEERTHRAAKMVFDISLDDIAWWQSRGLTNNRWLPPLLDKGLLESEKAVRDYDIGYLGNLRTPNNVEGICWFLREVVPYLAVRRPTLRVLIGGSEPVAEIVDLAARIPAVTLVPDVPKPIDVLGRVRVLVNPVFMSSGVNIKMIDMLAIGVPIVTTPAGAAGLPMEVHALLSITADAATFAEACVEQLEGKVACADADRIAAVRRWFGPEALAHALEGILA